MGTGSTRRAAAPRIDIGIGSADRRAIADGLGRVLTQRLQVHEKTAWMLRSLLR